MKTGLESTEVREERPETPVRSRSPQVVTSWLGVLAAVWGLASLSRWAMIITPACWRSIQQVSSSGQSEYWRKHWVGC